MLKFVNDTVGSKMWFDDLGDVFVRQFSQGLKPESFFRGEPEVEVNEL